MAEITKTETFLTEYDADTFKVENNTDTSSGDSDYCPSIDGSISESSADRKQPRLSRKRLAEESESRKLMRPWLLDYINSKRIPDLHWMNNDKTLVHIPWLHASRHTFDTEKDSTIFKLWAVHSGKYVPGQDDPDPKRWKANFRCAINSLSDVHEMKFMSCKKGQNAFKVYRFDADKRQAKKLCTANERTMSDDLQPPGAKKVCQRVVLNVDRQALVKAKKTNMKNPANDHSKLTIQTKRANQPAIPTTRVHEPAIATTQANQPVILMTQTNQPAIPMTRVHEPAIEATQAYDPTAAILTWLKQQQCEHYSDARSVKPLDEFRDVNVKNEVSSDSSYDGPGFYRAPEAAISCVRGVTTENKNFEAIRFVDDDYSSRTTVAQNTPYETSSYCLDVCDSPTGTDCSFDSALTDDNITEMIDEWQSEPKSEVGGSYFMQLTSVNVSSYAQDNNYSFHNMPAQVGLTQRI